MFQLKGKTALVTGGGSGIGAAICQIYARAGASVIVADLDCQTGEKTCQRINQSLGEARFICTDVSDEMSCGEAAEQSGPVDILVNNAGVGHVGDILHTTAQDLDRLYSVNVRGVFNMSRVFLPQMVNRNRGVIINMASIGGIIGVRDRAAYCATKFAVVGLTKSMALDHAQSGVRVICICPGRVETPFVAARIAEYPDPQKAYAEMASTQALGRMARPEEIAASALYLASDEASFITGSEFIIDGGWSAGK
jgi:NAD(P)-dependent dehydrogenase (short-subunit alcohol dehydrogenase family)